MKTLVKGDGGVVGLTETIWALRRWMMAGPLKREISWWGRFPLWHKKLWTLNLKVTRQSTARRMIKCAHPEALWLQKLFPADGSEGLPWVMVRTHCSTQDGQQHRTQEVASTGVLPCITMLRHRLYNSGAVCDPNIWLHQWISRWRCSKALSLFKSQGRS